MMSGHDNQKMSAQDLSEDEIVKLFNLAKAKGLKRKNKAKTEVIQPVPRSPEGEPLALAQRRIWFLSEQEQSASEAYIINGAFRLQGQIDVASLRATLDLLVRRHESLRTYFSHQDGQPWQQIMPEDVGFPPTEVEATDVDLTVPYLPRFDLSTGPLACGELVRIQENEHVLRIALHHAIADGWSMSVIIREVGVLYDALCRGVPNPLPVLPIQFADYAHWQQTLPDSELQRQRDFWIEQLSDAPERLTLMTDFPRPAVQNHAGES
ncbi:condensation domain-containing protein [Vibrio sp. PP-XX7]